MTMPPRRTHRLRSLVLAVGLAASIPLVPAGLTAQDSPAAVSTEGPAVTLLEPGAEPRAPLRYRLDAMTPGTMMIRMDTDMSISNPMMGQQQQTMPTMQMGTELQQVTPMDGGRLRMDFRMAGTEVLPREGADPAMIPILQSAMSQMGNPAGYSVIDDRGRVLDGGFSTEGLDPALQQQLSSLQDSISQMATPLPLEAVGVGASWRVDQSIQSNGLQIAQQAVYTLEDRTETAFRVRIRITQSATPQALQDPSLPPGVSMHLDSFSGSGEGSATIPFASLIPTSTMRVSSTMAMSADMGDGNRVPMMNMEMTISMAMAPRGN
jgi:hypothetical protein